jgi:hypothetical protein
MNIKHRYILFTITVLLAFCACTKAQDLSQLVKVGQSKEEIVEVVGTPQKTEVIVKTTEHVWGPEESFWSQIPMNTKLEVWHYKNKDGQLNLYFQETANSLSFKAFAPSGVVYESSE